MEHFRFDFFFFYHPDFSSAPNSSSKPNHFPMLHKDKTNHKILSVPSIYSRNKPPPGSCSIPLSVPSSEGPQRRLSTGVSLSSAGDWCCSWLLSQGNEPSPSHFHNFFITLWINSSRSGWVTSPTGISLQSNRNIQRIKNSPGRAEYLPTNLRFFSFHN